MSAHSYYMDDCSVVVPDNFIERTTNVLEWRTPDGDSLALVIHRQLLPKLNPEGKSSSFDLDRFVANETREYASKFAGMRLERDEATTCDSGFSMRRKALRWRNQADVFYQHQAFVLAGDRVIVLTAAAKAQQRESVDLMIDNALTSFRIRGDQ